MMPTIHYIKRADIDTVKWNACIEAAPNGLIYAYSFYLDALCDNWDALILGDYEVVMPLPFRNKWGITYVYTPPFIQQLGLFGNQIDQNITALFLEKAKERFSFGDYFINYDNETNNLNRTNFILNLNKTYTQLYSGYKTDLKKNLKKAQHFNLKYNTTSDYLKAINIYQQLYQQKIPHVKSEAFVRFTKLCNLLQQKGMICIKEVTEGKKLLAIALCLRDKKRFYLIACSTTEKGRKLSATHYLLDKLIQEFANTEYIFDFEGSDLPGVKSFYENFGSINQPYFFHHWNQLPWPIKLLKKH